MGYCVLVTNDTEDNIAYDVLKIRLNDKLWPIYIRTPFKKKLVVNYKVLFYVAGKNKMKQNIVASSIISDINYDFDDKKIFCELKLEEINFFKNPVDIKLVAQKLDFIKNKYFYGLSFVGGCNIIEKKDYDSIINLSK